MPSDKTEDRVDELRDALRGHDWYYAMSDDHSVWRKGEAAWSCILRLVRIVPDEDAQRLWACYAPDSRFPFPDRCDDKSCVVCHPERQTTTGRYHAGNEWHPFGCECPKCLK